MFVVLCCAGMLAEPLSHGAAVQQLVVGAGTGGGSGGCVVGAGGCVSVGSDAVVSDEATAAW